MSTDPTTPFPSRDRPEDMPPSDPWGQPLPPVDAPPSDDPTLHTPPPYETTPYEPPPSYPASEEPPSYEPPSPSYQPPPYPASEEPPPAIHTPPDGYLPPPVSAPPVAGPPVSAPPGYPPPVSAPPGYGSPVSGPPGYPPPVSAPPGYGSPVSGPPGYPPSAPAGSVGLTTDPGRVIAQIGEITVTSTEIRTPAGVMPLAGATWQVTEHWQSERETPGWAILAAVLGFLVLTVFSLLFLLVKRPIQQGTAQVTVSNGPHLYVTRVPVADQARLQHVRSQVDYVRSLAQ